MADHHITINYEKPGNAFNTVAEAHQQHLDDVGAGSTIADYETWAATKDCTSTTFLTSGGSEVASGNPGNGYSLKQVWTEAKLQTDLAALGPTDTSAFEVNGWSAISIDINPDTGAQYPDTWNE
jgi:hypothetical protein